MESKTKGPKEAKAVTPPPEVEEFANALDGCLAPSLSLAEKRARVLDLPRIFYENALRRMIQRGPNLAREGNDDMDVDADEHDSSKTEAVAKATGEVKQLEKEIRTWDLVRRLFPLRYSKPRPAPSIFSAPAEEEPPPPATTLDVFVDADPVLKERRAVLQWLQTNAATGPDIDDLTHELQQNADRGDIIAHGWLHTRSKIKLRKSMTAWSHLLDTQSPSVAASHTNSDGAPLVTQLDPDAVTRQDRKLEPQDEYFERAIWLGCFEHLRRGSSRQTIREWCQERTEMWRAVSMSGLLLTASEGEARLADIPPTSLVMWRRMCLSLARGGGTDDYERAVYGLLSGDIASVEQVAGSWDDYLFANVNALVRTQIDTFLLGLCPPDVATNVTQTFASFDAVQFHGHLDGVEKRLVATLESQESTRAEASEPYKALQASLIAGDLDRHMLEQALVLVRDANRGGRSLLLPRTLLAERPLLPSQTLLAERSVSPDNDGVVGDKDKFFHLGQHDGLRLVSHVCVLMVLLRQFDAQESKSGVPFALSRWQLSGQENIIAAYTDLLAQTNLQELIPLYCSVLSSPRGYEVLGWNMIHERDADKRLTQLKLIKRVGMDVLKFVETLAKLVFDELDPDDDTPLGKRSFSIIGAGPPTTRHGRGISADFFGDDETVISAKDEHVIRSLEWLLQVAVAWPEVLRIGVQAYKYFFRNTHMPAVRRLMERVPFDAILQNVTNEDLADARLLDDVDFWARHLEQSGITSADAGLVMTDARNFRDLECLATALDGLETMGSLMKLSAEYVTSLRTRERGVNGIRASSGDRKFWSGVGDAVKVMKDRMQPLLLDSWLLTSIQAGDKELGELRQVFLPEAILAFVSGLHYAGTSLSRDNLLECMDLASVVAERNSDLARAFIEGGRMRELVEAFAACSKALATTTGDKRAAGSSSKKLRETGWSRDLWAV